MLSHFRYFSNVDAATLNDCYFYGYPLNSKVFSGYVRIITSKSDVWLKNKGEAAIFTDNLINIYFSLSIHFNIYNIYLSIILLLYIFLFIFSAFFSFYALSSCSTTTIYWNIVRYLPSWNAFAINVSCAITIYIKVYLYVVENMRYIFAYVSVYVYNACA